LLELGEGTGMKNLFKSMILGAFAAILIQAAPVSAADEDCTSSGILGVVGSRFAVRAEKFLNSDLRISSFDIVETSAERPRDEYHSVGRTYCHAKADFNDGKKRDVWYLIERDWAFAGLGKSVEFCVSGLDPWHVYGRFCRSLRP
jgi:hypothetical protein